MTQSGSRSKRLGGPAWPGAAAVAAVAVLSLAGEGRAAGDPLRAPQIQGVLDCRKIEDGAARLAGFDQATAAMESAEAAGDLVTVDREQRRAARHQAFGLALSSLSFLDRGEKPDEVNHITAKVAEASQTALGKWVIRLDDGAIWRQTDDNTVDRPPHAGSTAEIRKGLLGSFTMKLDGQFAIKVHRDS